MAEPTIAWCGGQDDSDDTGRVTVIDRSHVGVSLTNALFAGRLPTLTGDLEFVKEPRKRYTATLVHAWHVVKD